MQKENEKERFKKYRGQTPNLTEISRTQANRIKGNNQREDKVAKLKTPAFILNESFPAPAKYQVLSQTSAEIIPGYSFAS